MQIIIEVEGDAADYAAQKRHKWVPVPENCGNCEKEGCMVAHGWYSRWVTDTLGKAVRIAVRRFFAEGVPAR